MADTNVGAAAAERCLVGAGIPADHAKQLVGFGCDEEVARAIVAFPGANILALINLFRQYGPVVMEIIKAIMGIFHPPTPAPPAAAAHRP